MDELNVEYIDIYNSDIMDKIDILREIVKDDDIPEYQYRRWAEKWFKESI